MLGVTETTVKRWSDEGVLRCAKTPGGHRKFHLPEVAEFAETLGLSLSGIAPPPMSKAQREELALGVSLGDTSRLASVLLDELLQADRAGVHELLMYLVTHDLSLALIADEVILPAFQQIGSLWEQGKLDVGQEHAASFTMQEALSRLVPSLHHKPQKEMIALVACPAHELHDLGLRCFSYCLQLEGWRVWYLGANTPAEAIVQQIRRLKPNLVALSLTSPQTKQSLRGLLKTIAKAVRSTRGVLIAGGSASSLLGHENGFCEWSGPTIQDSLHFIRTRFGLQPGPKRRHRVSR
jgi:methanogenic corrinoid protein MtbC1